MYRNGDAIDFADRVFHTFDTDKNGTVDFIEFAAGLTMMDSKMIEQKMSIDSDLRYIFSLCSFPPFRLTLRLTLEPISTT
jgi:Ca2+-binding EF-hand superfamily protein